MTTENGQNGKKSEGQLLAEKLCINKKNCWEEAGPEEAERIRLFAEDYKAFLDRGKTEREFTAETTALLRTAGFRDIEEIVARKGLEPGDKVYHINRDKSLVFAVLGSRPVSEGVNIVGAHVDSPRIDLKTNPLYEDGDLAFFDTQYYGGIKHYQWTAIPLALHGVIFGSDGKRITVRLGEESGDPVFTITDLLPHLAREQMQKKASEFFVGEDLNILAGSRPFIDEKVKEKVKLNLLKLLNEQYGITEGDFAGAELEFVPAHRARDIGFDRSMIGAYGHDDRSCAYAALRAALETAPIPEKTSVCLFTDKEEIGSMGNTGAQSRLLEDFVAGLIVGSSGADSGKSSDISLRRALNRSSMLSADVNSAYDPNFDSVYDKKNASYFGKGMVLCKYTGSGGKYGGSDANAEFYLTVRSLLDRNKVAWQYGDLGKVDKGGGGTIARYAAALGVEVLDCGIPVLSMHSPFEVISKIDLYTTYRGYMAFLREA
ncbi:MAG: aminopeptidase [Treponema sp.]|jgi:aspartyl aminopeptidase|nr:aminopeptidase [Treponema sp.]